MSDRPRGAVSAHTRADCDSYQILKSGNSAGANYEEADDGSSAKDALAKSKITLRELKETRFRLRVLRHTGLLLPEQDPVIQENVELIRIVATLIRNEKKKLKKQASKDSPPRSATLPVTTRAREELGVGFLLGVGMRAALGKRDDLVQLRAPAEGDRLEVALVDQQPLPHFGGPGAVAIPMHAKVANTHPLQRSKAAVGRK